MKILQILCLSTLFIISSFGQSKAIKPVESKGTTSYVATAYCLKGRTASGEYVRPGIVAADPRVLPINSKIFIEGYGNFIVKDTGGDIKGRRLDIWYSSCHEARKFGRRTVQVRRIL